MGGSALTTRWLAKLQKLELGGVELEAGKAT
jgi:hypothetical protein